MLPKGGTKLGRVFYTENGRLAADLVTSEGEVSVVDEEDSEGAVAAAVGKSME